MPVPGLPAAGRVPPLAPGQRHLAAAPAGPPLSTLYIGGGTPSLLTPQQLQRLLQAVRSHWDLAPGAELSLEMDPASFDLERLQAVLALGVNRVSLGGQSFDDQVLEGLGRRHRALHLIQSCAWLHRAQEQGDLQSWSLDLIVNLPGQTPQAWAWELEQFPLGWERFFDGYQEIWCPSSFTAQALAQRSPVPVIALPHLPDWPALQARAQARSRQRQQRPGQPFTFLTLFDFWSTPERKNPAAVIQAFQRAFPIQSGSNPAVQLLIKASSAEQFPAQAAALQALANDDPRIRWIEALLPQSQLDALYHQADALVSLHRAEGFGLTLAEAMAQAIPVIATGYSGNLDFMPPGSAELIPWVPCRIQRTSGDYRAGALWAEPDLTAAAEAMRRLATDPVAAEQLGWRGQAIARERLSPERLSAVVRQRLGRCWLPPSPDPATAAPEPAPRG